MRTTHLLLAILIILCNTTTIAADCPQIPSGAAVGNSEQVDLYVQPGTRIKHPQWIITRGGYKSPEEIIINRCSQLITAQTISDSLPERLNIFAHLPDAARGRSFIMVSNVDQKMAMDKTGPYWHAYVEPMTDLRFVGAVARHAHGLVTLDDSIRNSDDLRGKRVGLIPRPSSLRALQEIVLLQAWGIYEDIEVLEFMRPDMAGALERGDVDVAFMPVAQMVNGDLESTDIDITRDDLHWISLSAADVNAATTNTPVVADRIVFSPPQGATNGNAEVGLISFDAAWFTFASAPDDVVYEFLRLASKVCPATQPDCGGRATDTLLRWPDLDTDLIHPGAQRFYREHDLIED